MQNYYHLLGVSNFASFEEIASAYKKKNASLFEEGSALANIPLLRKLKEAFEILADDDKREDYDEKLMDFLEEVNQIYDSSLEDLKARNLDSCIEKINKCIKINPGEPDYYETLGLAFRLKGDLKNALWAYKQGVSTGMRTAFFHRYLADVYNQLKDDENADSHYLEAAEGFKEILTKDPKNTGCIEQLADVYVHILFYDEAIDLYRQLIALRPYDAVYKRDMGIALYESEQYEDAEKFLLESLRLKPGDAAALMFLGLVYFKKRLLETAVRTLQDSLSQKPDQPEVKELINQIKRVQLSIGRTVEEITYDAAPDAYVEGTVKWYNEERGIGMLTCDSYAEVLLHYTAIEGGDNVKLSKGDKVSFGIVKDKLCPVAVHVEKQEGPSESETFPGVIDRFDPSKKYGIIKSYDGKEIYFPFSALTDEAEKALAPGMEVLYETKSSLGLDDSLVEQAYRIRIRKKKQ